MRVIPIPAHAGITGFESPAVEYTQLGLSLDELLITHPNASFLFHHDSSTEIRWTTLQPDTAGLSMT
ncbi:hypothetical protein ABT47_23660 [Shewanella xiamenensis]|jgi:hypothetical protein|nr:hypothetical protein ABT47_23660 [Shewanella xiamenensis]